MYRLKSHFKWSSLLVGYYFFPTIPSAPSSHLMKMSNLNELPSLRGMKRLDRKLFDKTIIVPCLKVKAKSVPSVISMLKNKLLKLKNVKNIRSVVSTSLENKNEDEREVLLNPKAISSFSDLSDSVEKLKHLGVEESSFGTCPLHLTYENWSADDILSAILPEDVDISSGYSLVGHIVHVNLREHLLEFKHLIGELLLDKIPQARTVVNKVDTIDNTFRIFNMEVLAGEPDFITEVKENGLRFKFDFSAVYWNTRLGTEHERIVKKLNPGNILYDVFAGVGPFSILAAKKKCIVLANDLNPESHKWLKYNSKLNKVDSLIKTFNKDGAEFIKQDVKQHILLEGHKNQIHIVMNLPALAVTFLKNVKHLFTSVQIKSFAALPTVHVYCFVKGVEDPKIMAKAMVEKELNCSITEALDEIFFVRNVAPNKNMMRVSFKLTENVILDKKRVLDSDDYTKELKKLK